MSDWLIALLEIVKVALPALIVYLTAKHLLSRHLGALERVSYQHLHAKDRSVTLPMRLQAFERLSVFCERISLPNLLLRLRERDQTAGELKLALYLAIQQEYEHNISQQVYMTQQLWDIIRQARDNTLQGIESVSDIVDADMPSRELARALIDQAADGTNRGLALALAAIKKEASVVYQ